MFDTNGLHGRAIADVPVAVIDFETTGMFPGSDRVVEVSVVRVEPGRPPELVLDTLVNPIRRMGCTFVHGITDHDVIDAPRFEQVAEQLIKAVAGCVVSAYNVTFDLRFLDYELNRVGVRHAFPHMCLMYMRPMLGLGRQCKLADACWAHGIPLSNAHAAAPDALAAAGLWSVYRAEIENRNIRTFAELAAVKRYKFTASFECEPHPGIAHDTGPAPSLKPRISRSGHAPSLIGSRTHRTPNEFVAGIATNLTTAEIMLQRLLARR